MAIRRVDDLDHETPVEEATVFSFQGVTYSIDLGPANLTKLEKLLEPYMENASTMVSQTAARATPAASGNLQAIRAWAQAKGLQVADRGQIKQEIKDAYFKEHPEEAA